MLHFISRITFCTNNCVANSLECLQARMLCTFKYI